MSTIYRAAQNPSRRRTSIADKLAAAAVASAVLTSCGCMQSGGGNDMPDLRETLHDLSGPLPDIAGLKVNGVPVVRLTGGFAQPFGAYFDAATNAWYVSNVAGDLNDYKNLKDGIGWITKISADYLTVDHSFFTTGLNAPAGMRVVNGKLFVADVDQMVVIDLASRTAVRSAQVKSANPILHPYVLLTDVALDDIVNLGAAYLTDVLGSRIVRFPTPMTGGGTYITLYPAGVTFPTTVYWDSILRNLFVGTSGDPAVANSKGILLKMTPDGAGSLQIGSFQAKYQGIEGVNSNEYLVGTKSHQVFHITPAVQNGILVRDVGMEGAFSCGDIGWDAASRTLAVPDPGTNSVYFYRL